MLFNNNKDSENVRFGFGTPMNWCTNTGTIKR